MGNLPDSLGKLIEASKTSLQGGLPPGETEVIIVDEVAARVASFYERIRGIVDWREEHVLRKSAIERVLKRRMLLEKGLLLGEDGSDVAEQFLKELIRGGHFPNRKISMGKVEEVRLLLNKYIFILEKGSVQEARDKNALRSWFMQMASYEVEITLAPHEKEIALMLFMTEDLLLRVKLRNGTNGGISEDETKLQVYVAVHRALFKTDNPVISYHLLERISQDWHTPSEETVNNAASHIVEVRDLVNRMLFHPLGERVYRLAERYDTH